MARPKTIRQQGEAILKEMFSQGKGTSKYADKQINAGKPAKEKIYVDSTLKTYRQGWQRYCDFLSEQGIHTRDMEEASRYLQAFIDWLVAEDYSAYTVHTWASAAAKVYGASIRDYSLPKRSRCAIKRSRGPVKNDAHFSPANHQALVDFSRSVGPRNDKELAHIRGTDLVELENGGFAVNIRKGKGGKQRYAPICGSPERVKRVVAMMREAGDQLLFPHIPTAADIHGYRAEYACTIYAAHARPLAEIPKRRDTSAEKTGLERSMIKRR